VIHKVVAGRPRDVADLEGIIARQGRGLDFRRIRRWLAEFSAIEGMPDFEETLDRVLASSKPKRKAKVRRTATRH
jgi:hypothetical protein